MLKYYYSQEWRLKYYALIDLKRANNNIKSVFQFLISLVDLKLPSLISITSRTRGKFLLKTTISYDQLMNAIKEHDKLYEDIQ